MLKQQVAALLFGFFISPIALAGGGGMIKKASVHSAEKTADSLLKLLKNKQFTIFKVINHSENAKKSGMELSDNKVIIFGNPKVGSPLMKASPSIGLDLPIRMHIHTEAGKTWVTYNDPTYLAKRHDLPATTPQIQKMTKALKGIVDKITNK